MGSDSLTSSEHHAGNRTGVATMITLRQLDIKARELRNGDELSDGGIVVDVFLARGRVTPVSDVIAIVDYGHPEYNETRTFAADDVLNVSREDYIEN